MVTKCGICGKTAIFGTILKCESCGQYICHRHDREQFSAITVTGMGEVTPLGPYTQMNYPSGESFKAFRCYKCRTAKEPDDMGKGRLLFVELYFQASVIMMVAISLLTFFGAMTGLETNAVDSMLWYAVTYFLVSVAIELSALLIEYRRMPAAMKDALKVGAGKRSKGGGDRYN